MRQPSTPAPASPTVSVIIPTWNEAATIAATLVSLEGQGADEVIVADATSPDGTAELAAGACTRVVDSPRGRGVQQNRGAAATTGEILVFLHADCRLEHGAIAALRRFVTRHPNVPGGCFRMRVASPGLGFRAIDLAADLRAGLLGIPYGDQGLFVRRRAFLRVGGFPELPLMEDVFLAFALRRLGRLVVLSYRVSVSPRRWHRCGLIRQTLVNWALTGSATLGVRPDVLVRFYPAVR